MKPSDLREATELLDQLAQCDRLLGAKMLENTIYIEPSVQDRREEYEKASRKAVGDPTPISYEPARISVSLAAEVARNLVIKTRRKTIIRLGEIGIEVPCTTSEEHAKKAPTARHEAPIAWVAHETDAILTQLYGAPVRKNKRIITRNSDGGTSAWSEDEARELAKSITEILDAFSGFQRDNSAAQKKNGGAEAPPAVADKLPWYRRRP